jgi:hypothetical protein
MTLVYSSSPRNVGMNSAILSSTPHVEKSVNDAHAILHGRSMLRLRIIL